MASSPTSKVMQNIRGAVLLPDGAGLSDGQLLECYVRRREETAFAALVRRHGPMVWGVCLRVLGNHHDAEDAFQAAFLVLVRKAAAVVPRALVANWLHGVAYRTALKAKALAARRRAKERLVARMPEPETVEQDHWCDLQPLLDRELSRLPDKYRVPVVLCDLEGKTYQEAARQVGCPPGTLSARLTRARATLARRLARHGPLLSGASLAAVLSQGSGSARVPAPLVASTIRATGVVSANVAALTEGVLKSMLLTRLKIATAVLLLLAAAGLGAGGLIYHTQAAEPANATVSTKPLVQEEKEGEPPAQEAPQGPERGAGRQARPGDTRDVWTLDFSFKDPRRLRIEVPYQGKKEVLYLLYDLINNTGEDRTAVLDFELVSADGNTVYRDVILPRVEEAIRKVEDPTEFLKIKNSVTIATEPIPPCREGQKSRRVAGVAVWDDVPPEADRFTVFVSGLSNAWSVTEPIPPDTEPVIRRKALQLTFKREGDKMVFVPPAAWVYRKGSLRAPAADGRGTAIKPAAGGPDGEERKVLRAIIEELERQRAPLLVEERDRRVYLEVVTLRLQALRKAVEEEKPSGAEADRARERLRGLEDLEQQIKSQNREKQIFLQLLNRRLQELRKDLGEPADKEEGSPAR
jgi:RNA polymerase sigma factor (sigma-70 family)